MRHPDAERLLGACREALPGVLEAARLPTGMSLQPDTEGWVNVCWLGSDIVVRFNARDPELPKFHREEWAYRHLGEQGFPVPRLIAHIEDQRIAPFPALVTERLGGQNLEATWRTLTPERLERISRSAGRWLARLHGVRLPGFGEVFQPGYESQRAYWGERLSVFLDQARRLVSARDVERLESALAALLPRLDVVREPRFVHGDYHFGNLLHDGNAIVGILDFEWAMASDPAVDRAQWDVLDWATPGARPDFDRAYFQEFGPVTEDKQPNELYRLTRQLELAAVADRFFTPAEREESIGAVRRTLDSLDQPAP